MPLAVFMLTSCQYTPEEEFRYVEQSFSLKTYQFPTLAVGALHIVQVELNAKRLSAESVSIRGSLAPQMDELAERYSDRGALEVISIDFLDADGAKLAQQGVAFERLVPTTDGKYTFSIDANIDADRFDQVESIDIGWSQLLDDAVSAYLETDKSRN